MPVLRGFLIVPVDVQVVASTSKHHHFNKSSNLIVGFRSAVRVNTITDLGIILRLNSKSKHNAHFKISLGNSILDESIPFVYF